MTGRMKLYIGLLVLGLVLVGGGLWFLFNPTSVINIPEGDPIITTNATRVMGGEFSSLSIYEDGTVIYRKDEGLRISTPEHPPTRTWKIGCLQAEEISSLISFFKSSNFAGLNEYYQYPSANWTSGAISDLYYTVSINYDDLHKEVTAFGYLLTPDGDIIYPGMPYPLNEIYRKFKQIIENETELIYEESIKD